MGQNASHEVLIEKYVQFPFITREDVHQIINCFEYMNPKDGVVDLSRLDEETESLPNYMQDIVDELKANDSLVTFDEFFMVMKPKLTAIKNHPDTSVILDNTSMGVFCVICPFKTTQEIK